MGRVISQDIYMEDGIRFVTGLSTLKMSKATATNPEKMIPR